MPSKELLEGAAEALPAIVGSAVGAVEFSL